MANMGVDHRGERVFCGKNTKGRRSNLSACPREGRCACRLLALEAPLVVDHVPGLFLRDRGPDQRHHADRKSTRLNSSHLVISYAVFCLKKKKKVKSPYGVQCAHSTAPRTS